MRAPNKKQTIKITKETQNKKSNKKIMTSTKEVKKSRNRENKPTHQEIVNYRIRKPNQIHGNTNVTNQRKSLAKINET